MPKLSVELPQGLIDDLDRNKRNYCRDLGVPIGIGRVNLIEGLLRAGIEHAQTPATENPPENPPETPAPILKPAPHLPDYTPVNKSVLTAGLPLTRRTIDAISTEALTALIFDTETPQFTEDADLKVLANLTPAQLSRKLQISITDANRLALAFEFAKRVARSYSEREKITAPRDVADILMPKLRYLQHEVVVCMALDTKGNVTDNLCIAENTADIPSGLGNYIGHQLIYEGTLNASVFHPREIFRYAIDCNANSIILAHNHPSGDPQPSQEDIRATKQLIEAGNAIGIKVLDHIVIGDGIFVSLKEENFI